jgi:cation diffusion facilitator family transporter
VNHHGHHDHDHEQDHEHGNRRGLLSAIRHAFSGHSHDANSQVDTALEASEDGIRTLKLSLVVLGLTAMAQLGVVFVSGSVALFGDTLHNFADALTAVPLWLAFTLGRRSPNRRYTYGYGRAEDLAGIAIIATIAASAVAAAWVAIDRLLHPQAVHAIPWVVAAGVIGFLGNETAARWRIRTGRRIGSAALVADGIHARTDGVTSLAVIVGAVGVAAGFRLADPVVGLVISLAIAAVCRDAARDVYYRLMDAVDPALVDRAGVAAAAVPGVEAVESIRVRWIGHRLRAEVEVGVADALGLAAAHEIAHETEHALLHALPKLDHAIVHASPIGPTGTAAHHVIAHHAGSRPAQPYPHG